MDDLRFEQMYSISGRDIQQYIGDSVLGERIQETRKAVDDIIQILHLDSNFPAYKILRNFRLVCDGKQEALTETFGCEGIGKLIDETSQVLIGMKDTMHPQDAEKVQQALDIITKTAIRVKRKITPQKTSIGDIQMANSLDERLAAIDDFVSSEPLPSSMKDVFGIILTLDSQSDRIQCISKLMTSEELRDFWSHQDNILYIMMCMKKYTHIAPDDMGVLLKIFILSPHVSTFLQQVEDTYSILKKIKSNIGRAAFSDIFGSELSKTLG